MSNAVPEPFEDKDALRRKAGAAKDAVADLAVEAGHFASTKARDAKESAVAWAQTAKDAAAGAGERAVEYIERHPYPAIALAAGIGFMAGLLLKRR